MILLLLMVVCVGVACGKPAAETIVPDEGTPEIEHPSDQEGMEIPEIVEEIIEEPTFPFYSPLTGIGSEVELKQRPVMVMIENSPQARPQTGLDQADIVYEILAEGEITRFAALYHSQSPEVIGPVRSIRPYYVEIGEAYDALIVHAGWSQEAINMIRSKRLAHFDQVYGDDAYYWRATDRKMPHNLYTSIKLIRKGAIQKKYRDEWNERGYTFMSKDEQQAIGTLQTPAQKVTIPYIRGYEVTYDYNEASGQYLRTMAGKPHEDTESGKQLTASNILVLSTKHRVLDSEGRRSVDVTGSGKGHIFQQGRMLEITWKKSDHLIRAFIGDEEVALVPGQTWIQIVPEGTELSYE